MAAVTQADAVGLGLLLALLVIGAVLTLPSIGDALARFKARAPLVKRVLPNDREGSQ